MDYCVGKAIPLRAHRIDSDGDVKIVACVAAAYFRMKFYFHNFHIWAEQA